MNEYKKLAAAIVERAVLDYKDALHHEDDFGALSVEHFFQSDWFKMLSDCNGDRLMQMIRRKVEHERTGISKRN